MTQYIVLYKSCNTIYRVKTDYLGLYEPCGQTVTVNRIRPRVYAKNGVVDRGRALK